MSDEKTLNAIEEARLLDESICPETMASTVFFSQDGTLFASLVEQGLTVIFDEGEKKWYPTAFVEDGKRITREEAETIYEENSPFFDLDILFQQRLNRQLAETTKELKEINERLKNKEKGDAVDWQFAEKASHCSFYEYEGSYYLEHRDLELLIKLDKNNVWQEIPYKLNLLRRFEHSLKPEEAQELCAEFPPWPLLEAHFAKKTKSVEEKYLNLRQNTTKKVIGWTYSPTFNFLRRENISPEEEAAIVNDLIEHGYFFAGDCHDDDFSTASPVMEDYSYIALSTYHMATLMAHAQGNFDKYGYSLYQYRSLMNEDSFVFPDGHLSKPNPQTFPRVFETDEATLEVLFCLKKRDMSYLLFEVPVPEDGYYWPGEILTLRHEEEEVKVFVRGVYRFENLPEQIYGIETLNNSWLSEYYFSKDRLSDNFPKLCLAIEAVDKLDDEYRNEDAKILSEYCYPGLVSRVDFYLDKEVGWLYCVDRDHPEKVFGFDLDEKQYWEEVSFGPLGEKIDLDEAYEITGPYMDPWRYIYFAS